MLFTLADQQRRQGHTPIILSIGNHGSGEKAIETEAGRCGITCIPHRMRDGMNLSGAARVLEIASNQQADVIHSHGYKTNILMGILSGSARRQPVLTTLHGWTAKQAFSKLGLYRLLDQWSLRRLDAVVIVSERMKHLRGIRTLAADKLHVIPNGIAIERRSASGDAKDPAVLKDIANLRSGGRTLIAAVGRLSPEKNFAALIEAVRHGDNPQLAVMILGTGPQEAMLRAMIEQHELSSRVLLGGLVPQANAYLPFFDLLVIPSMTEGLPMILLEAMQANLPVIASEVGDIATVLAGRGLLTTPGDTRQLAEAIDRMTSNLGFYRQQAATSAQHVADHYSAATMAQRYEHVYRSMLQ